MDDTGKVQSVKEQIVSNISGLSLSTLRKQRYYGTGIPYMKLGKAVRYDLRDVYAFLQNAKVFPRG
ncbi:MAG: hypothetical protein A2X91_09805 [Deltaproteobacteria bacterium GWB2_65_81]|nr:MAG: hypothetical protein A2X90_03930 [Deltaproteobacteria bacterium GWA2_65_63]OGP28120.1 MAG: hypothetical protein A2X91_09805 [Deltaproteobacteria bacterium GWB2_65_81]